MEWWGVNVLIISLIITSLNGLSLKCGEEIVVKKGEKKVLKFWSTEDELLNVDVISKNKIKGAQGIRIQGSQGLGIRDQELGGVRDGGSEQYQNNRVNAGDLNGDVENDLYYNFGSKITTLSPSVVGVQDGIENRQGQDQQENEQQTHQQNEQQTHQQNEQQTHQQNEQPDQQQNDQKINSTDTVVRQGADGTDSELVRQGAEETDSELVRQGAEGTVVRQGADGTDSELVRQGAEETDSELVRQGAEGTVVRQGVENTMTTTIQYEPDTMTTITPSLKDSTKIPTLKDSTTTPSSPGYSTTTTPSTKDTQTTISASQRDSSTVQPNEELVTTIMPQPDDLSTTSKYSHRDSSTKIPSTTISPEEPATTIIPSERDSSNILTTIPPNGPSTTIMQSERDSTNDDQPTTIIPSERDSTKISSTTISPNDDRSTTIMPSERDSTNILTTNSPNDPATTIIPSERDSTNISTNDDPSTTITPLEKDSTNISPTTIPPQYDPLTTIAPHESETETRESGGTERVTESETSTLSPQTIRETEELTTVYPEAVQKTAETSDTTTKPAETFETTINPAETSKPVHKTAETSEPVQGSNAEIHETFQDTETETPLPPENVPALTETHGSEKLRIEIEALRDENEIQRIGTEIPTESPEVQRDTIEIPITESSGPETLREVTETPATETPSPETLREATEMPNERSNTKTYEETTEIYPETLRDAIDSPTEAPSPEIFREISEMTTETPEEVRVAASKPSSELNNKATETPSETDAPETLRDTTELPSETPAPETRVAATNPPEGTEMPATEAGLETLRDATETPAPDAQGVTGTSIAEDTVIRQGAEDTDSELVRQGAEDTDSELVRQGAEDTDSELVRQGAEDTDSELVRQGAEDTDSELVRQGAEDTDSELVRQGAEDTDSELVRQGAEDTDSELVRQGAEDTVVRQGAEDTDSELVRQGAEDTDSELVRQGAEDTDSELVRQGAESTDSELVRQGAENTDSELVRQGAEDTDSELVRQGAEDTDSELVRQGAEDTVVKQGAENTDGEPETSIAATDVQKIPGAVKVSSGTSETTENQGTEPGPVGDAEGITETRMSQTGNEVSGSVEPTTESIYILNEAIEYTTEHIDIVETNSSVESIRGTETKPGMEEHSEQSQGGQTTTESLTVALLYIRDGEQEATDAPTQDAYPDADSQTEPGIKSSTWKPLTFQEMPGNEGDIFSSIIDHLTAALQVPIEEQRPSELNSGIVNIDDIVSETLDNLDFDDFVSETFDNFGPLGYDENAHLWKQFENKKQSGEYEIPDSNPTVALYDLPTTTLGVTDEFTEMPPTTTDIPDYEYAELSEQEDFKGYDYYEDLVDSLVAKDSYYKEGSGAGESTTIYPTESPTTVVNFVYPGLQTTTAKTETDGSNNEMQFPIAATDKIETEDSYNETYLPIDIRNAEKATTVSDIEVSTDKSETNDSFNELHLPIIYIINAEKATTVSNIDEVSMNKSETTDSYNEMNLPIIDIRNAEKATTVSDIDVEVSTDKSETTDSYNEIHLPILDIRNAEKATTVSDIEIEVPTTTTTSLDTDTTTNNSTTAFSVPLVLLRNQEMLNNLLNTQKKENSRIVITEQGSRVAINSATYTTDDPVDGVSTTQWPSDQTSPSVTTTPPISPIPLFIASKNNASTPSPTEQRDSESNIEDKETSSEIKREEEEESKKGDQEDPVLIIPNVADLQNDGNTEKIELFPLDTNHFPGPSGLDSKGGFNASDQTTMQPIETTMQSIESTIQPVTDQEVSSTNTPSSTDNTGTTFQYDLNTIVIPYTFVQSLGHSQNKQGELIPTRIEEKVEDIQPPLNYIASETPGNVDATGETGTVAHGNPSFNQGSGENNRPVVNDKEHTLVYYPGGSIVDDEYSEGYSEGNVDPEETWGDYSEGRPGYSEDGDPEAEGDYSEARPGYSEGNSNPDEINYEEKEYSEYNDGVEFEYDEEKSEYDDTRPNYSESNPVYNARPQYSEVEHEYGEENSKYNVPESVYSERYPDYSEKSDYDEDSPGYDAGPGYSEGENNEDKAVYGEGASEYDAVRSEYGEDKPQYDGIPGYSERVSDIEEDSMPEYSETKPQYSNIPGFSEGVSDDDVESDYGEAKPQYSEGVTGYEDDSERSDYGESRPQYSEGVSGYEDDGERSDYGESRPQYNEGVSGYEDDGVRSDYGEGRPQYSISEGVSGYEDPYGASRPQSGEDLAGNGDNPVEYRPLEYNERTDEFNPESDEYIPEEPVPGIYGQEVMSRKDDEGPNTYGGDSPFFIKLPGSPNAVPVFLQYEPVQIKYVPLDKFRNNANQKETDSEDGLDSQEPSEFAAEGDEGVLIEDVNEKTNLEASGPQNSQAKTEYTETEDTVGQTELREENPEETPEQEGSLASSLMTGIYRILDDVSAAVNGYQGQTDTPQQGTPIQYKPSRYGASLPETSQYGTSQPETRYETSQYGTNHQDTSRHETNRYGIGQQEASRYGASQQGQYEKSQQGINEYSPSQRGTDEYSTSQYGTDQAFTPNQPIVKTPDPFFLMEAPKLGSRDPSDNHQSHSTDEREDSNRFKVQVSSTLGFEAQGGSNKGVVDDVPLGPREEILYPGEYSVHNSFTSINLTSLINPIFELSTKKSTPSEEERMNPQYTPFPITTNPPRTKPTTESYSPSTSPTTSTTTSTTQTPTTTPKSTPKTPSSVEFSPIPATNFEDSYDADYIPEYFYDSENAIVSLPSSAPDVIEAPGNIGGILHTDTRQVSAAPFRISYEAVPTPTTKTTTSATTTTTSAVVTEATTEEEAQDTNFRYQQAWTFPQSREGAPEDPKYRFLEASPDKVYSKFYSAKEIPGLDPTNFGYRQAHSTYNQPRISPPPIQPQASAYVLGPEFFKYLNDMPVQMQSEFLNPNTDTSLGRKKRDASTNEQIFCEWNIKTEPGLYLLMTFHNLSAPYTVDCHGAYIEVERENNGYDARWCGNRVSQDGSRPHVIFAKTEVRITVYDDGDDTKTFPTGFEADIEVIDLFDARDYTDFMRSSGYTQIRRLLNG